MVLFVFNAKYDNFTEMFLITLSHPREIVDNWLLETYCSRRSSCIVSMLWNFKVAVAAQDSRIKSNICCTLVSSYGCSSLRQFLQDCNKRLAGNLDSSSRLTNKKIKFVWNFVVFYVQISRLWDKNSLFANELIGFQEGSRRK